MIDNLWQLKEGNFFRWLIINVIIVHILLLITLNPWKKSSFYFPWHLLSFHENLWWLKIFLDNFFLSFFYRPALDGTFREGRFLVFRLTCQTSKQINFQATLTHNYVERSGRRYGENHWEEKCPEVSERETSLNQLFFCCRLPFENMFFHFSPHDQYLLFELCLEIGEILKRKIHSLASGRKVFFLVLENQIITETPNKKNWN